MDEQAELDRFAELLMELVRDRAIAICDQLANGTIRGPSGDRWRVLVADGSVDVALTELIPEIVDQTLFQLLDAIDNAKLPLSWVADDGSQTTLRDLGKWEMAGWLASGDWPERFSGARHHDYFADLPLEVEPDES